MDEDYAEHGEIETRSVYPVELEYRQRGRVLQGSFPYTDSGMSENVATVSDRGRVRKEAFAPRAFDFAVKDESREINLLSGHNFDFPLGSKLAKSLTLTDSASALSFRATLPPESEQPSWMLDAVLAVRGGLVRGISPGFKVPPSDVVPDAEELIPEPGNPDVMIRFIRAAVLFELSLVTRASYPNTEIDLRSGMAVVGQGAAKETFSELTWLLL